jgi:hypothetical protein
MVLGRFKNNLHNSADHFTKSQKAIKALSKKKHHRKVLIRAYAKFCLSECDEIGAQIFS